MVPSWEFSREMLIIPGFFFALEPNPRNMQAFLDAKGSARQGPVCGKASLTIESTPEKKKRDLSKWNSA